VAYATVAADVHKALDVELDFRTEIALHLVVALDHFTHGGCLVVCPVLHFDVFVYTRLGQDGVGGTPANAEDVGQGYFTSLVLRQIYADYSYCHFLS
jgi:hypothetical protein